MTGTIARIVKDKGFGFIKGADSVERFFHRSGVVGPFESLKEQQDVTFEDEQNPKGPRAVNVKAV